ncbi:MAG: hypothetical protein U5L45_21255 [Saprospiraceae bacterium]|nr:hypothetical protein [Saprospiraceae bacterium]
MFRALRARKGGACGSFSAKPKTNHTPLPRASEASARCKKRF